MKTWLIFFLSLIPVFSFGNECEPNVDSCSYYLCQEKKHLCGPQGYPLGFGFKFCQIYLNSEKNYSPEAHAWLRRVRVCLMEAFEEAERQPGPRWCGEIKKTSFHSHIGCYVQTGFCELSTMDQLQIFWAMKSSIVHPEIFQDGREVARACLSRTTPRPVAPSVLK